MIGAGPKFQNGERVSRLSKPAKPYAFRQVQAARNGWHRWRWVALLAAFIPLSFVLVQCGQAPNAGTLAANVPPSPGASFDERFPKPQFRDRFPTASESFEQRPDLAPKRTAQASTQLSAPGNAQMAGQPAPYRVASLGPQLPFPHPPRGDETMLVSLKSSAFPYFGNNPRTDEPFLNVSSGGRHGHRGMGGRVFWQDETFNDNRVLMHVPESFDINKPGVIVVFFHGNGATLERDVRDRQRVPQQISDSGVNAVLLAPQLAVNAADSSAGKFWQPGGLKRFVTESADHLASLYGDPRAAKTFANMPVIIVGYSGGFLPTAWSLEVGGLGNRVRGVFLLDAVYGELDKFASWIENNRSGFFVSSYTHYTARHDQELMRMLREKGIAVSEDMDRPFKPGSVVFVETPEGVTHRDYVTHAWTQNPVEDVLVKMAATPALTRIATSSDR
ncbi:MAG TPA: alpha/beta hydrolase [Bradyrhizobium sp.]